MADNSKDRRSGLFGNVLGLIVGTLFILVLSLFVSILVEWLGLYFQWWDNGIYHSFHMLEEELSYANSTVRTAINGDDGGGWFYQVAVYYKQIMYDFFYITSKFFLFFTTSEDVISVFADSGFNISQVFMLRTMLILFSFPLFLMVFIWGLVDGLVERDLRRFGAGRESSTIFEASRRLSFPLLVLPFIVYLSFPTSINPLYIIPPSAIFQAVLYRMIFSKYKKYL